MRGLRGSCVRLVAHEIFGACGNCVNIIMQMDVGYLCARSEWLANLQLLLIGLLLHRRTQRRGQLTRVCVLRSCLCNWVRVSRSFRSLGSRCCVCPLVSHTVAVRWRTQQPTEWSAAQHSTEQRNTAQAPPWPLLHECASSHTQRGAAPSAHAPALTRAHCADARAARSRSSCKHVARAARGGARSTRRASATPARSPAGRAAFAGTKRATHPNANRPLLQIASTTPPATTTPTTNTTVHFAANELAQTVTMPARTTHRRSQLATAQHIWRAGPHWPKGRHRRRRSLAKTAQFVQTAQGARVACARGWAVPAAARLACSPSPSEAAGEPKVKQAPIVGCHWRAIDGCPRVVRMSGGRTRRELVP